MILLSLPRINSWLTLSCLVGLGLSLYAYTVELQVEANENYEAMCDISPQVSCTKAFKSDYGKGFGIFGKGSMLHKPNSLFGLMFYSMIATLAQSNARFTVLFSVFAIAISNILCLYFAYVLYFVLYDLCIVCVSIYIVNVVNLILIQLKVKALKALEENQDDEDKDK